MKIEIINKEAETAIAVRYDAVDFTNMAATMKEGYQKLFDYITECGKQIVDCPYCKYFNGSEDFMKFDIELGIPVSELLPEKNEIFMSKTCEGKAITAIHKGAYKDIEHTYIPMMQYLEEHKLQSTGVYYDYYLNDPSDTVESELLTKIVFPLQ
jgi:Transcriptional regulator, effector-binding domain/component